MILFISCYQNFSGLSLESIDEVFESPWYNIERESKRHKLKQGLKESEGKDRERNASV